VDPEAKSLSHRIEHPKTAGMEHACLTTVHGIYLPQVGVIPSSLLSLELGYLGVVGWQVFILLIYQLLANAEGHLDNS
jgi:hypothetical protein